MTPWAEKFEQMLQCSVLHRMQLVDGISRYPYAAQPGFNYCSGWIMLEVSPDFVKRSMRIQDQST
jgi:hypothetical protein